MHSKPKIIANLQRFQRRALSRDGRRLAAVAIILSETDEGIGYILTRRSLTLRRGAGNYALPGGNVDPEDVDLVAAAIRETSEELGVTLLRQDVITVLDDFETIGGHLVTPIVFWAGGPITLVPDPVEVHAAWFVPLSDLDHADAPRFEPNGDADGPLLQMHMRGEWINVPTAAWLFQFREAALRGLTVRIDQLNQPNWTRN